MSKKPVFVLVAVLITAYVLLFFVSFGGWGYAGYGGYHRGPSFFYFGGPRYYSDRSIRSGSTGGTNTLGGGPGRGK